MAAPLVVDLFCGLGGWTEGLLAEGWRARGYDIEAHEYGDERYPGEFVQRDILEMHGSEIADADLIVSSSPCTEYSYMSMPWSLAKAKAAAIRADETGEALRKLNALFDAQFRIQREASEAKGEWIPMVVENVRGAQPWVGRARGSYGSYYLWGDVPALMPRVSGGGGRARNKSHPGEQWNINRKNFTGTLGWDQSDRTDEGLKNPGFRFDGSGKSFQTESVERHVDGVRDAGSFDASYAIQEGRKGAGYCWHKKGTGAWALDPISRSGSHGSSARKAASAKIAKIPEALSRWIGQVYFPR